MRLNSDSGHGPTSEGCRVVVGVAFISTLFAIDSALLLHLAYTLVGEFR